MLIPLSAYVCVSFESAVIVPACCLNSKYLLPTLSSKFVNSTTKSVGRSTVKVMNAWMCG